MREPATQAVVTHVFAESRKTQPSVPTVSELLFRTSRSVGWATFLFLAAAVTYLARRTPFEVPRYARDDVPRAPHTLPGPSLRSG